MKNKELNEQLKVLIEKNDDLLAQTNVLKDQLQVKHVVIDTHVECQEKYAKLEAERYEYMIRYSAYFDNDKQHTKQIADQKVLYDKMSVQLVELDKHVRDLKNTVLEKDFKISELEECARNKDLEIEKCLEPNKFTQTVCSDCDLEKIIIDLEDEVVSILEKEKENLKTIESLKSKDVETCVESSEKVVSETKNQSENDCQVVEKERDNLENSNVIDPGWSSNTVKADLSSVNHSNLNKNVKRCSRKNLMACNNYDTRSAFDCNNARNALCNARMNASVDVDDLFVFDDVSIRKSHVGKMPFRKKPRDSLNIVQICLWIIDSGCSKHMTGNRA
nr:hypothetical protein [Tanacetum cinerariifolium]